MPSADPTDINQGSRFVFLKKDATERMRRNKRKVRYIFEGEENNEPAPQSLPNSQLVQHKNMPVKPQLLIAKLNYEPVEEEKKEDQIEAHVDLSKNIGESGQTPENFQRDQQNSSRSF